MSQVPDCTSPVLDEVARVLAEEAGLSLASGLRTPLREGLRAAAAARGEEPAALARTVMARDAAAIEAVLEHAVVTETFFWRHPEQLAALAARLAPEPAALSLWCAGCATGEETYSLAIALLEAGRGFRQDRIVGTDLSTRALASARAAEYGARALRRLPPEALASWLEPGGADGARRVSRAVSSRVTFARQNLVKDPPPGGPFDAILCRNVLIYFEPAVAAAVLVNLAGALRPGGLLVLGPVELPLATAVPLRWLHEAGATLLLREA